MTLDKLRKGSLAAEGGFLSENVPVELNGVGRSGRRRMRLQRIRPAVVEAVSGGDSDISSDYDCCNKKRRSVKLMENKTYGLTSVIGRRREMEDATAVELGFLRKGKRSYDFFGVYDGHGGCRVAESCREMMHKFVGEESGEGNDDNFVDWEKVMATAFEKMDEEVNRAGAEMATMGSTAVVAVVGDDEVVVANCGDSRAVMFRGGVALQLSDDHKPDRPDELERIENSGGKVINWNGQRVLGVLATTRSIGDEFLKPYVISEPEVKIFNRTKSDEFLILASDGLWDVISNDVACQVARRCLNGKLRLSNLKLSEVEECKNSSNGRSRASEAAAILTELAIGRGSSDNISVIVVELKRSSKV